MGFWVGDNLVLRRQPIVEAKLHEFTTVDSNSTHSIKPGRSLMVRLAASHWGYVNRNGFYYDPLTIDGTKATWTIPRPLPVLTFHPGLFDGEPDTIGRIITVDYTKGIAAQFVEDDLIPNNVPDGYLEFTTRISEPTSQQKIIDGRYDTVSISAVATNVLCSICNKRIDINNSTCKHDRWKRYDTKGKRTEDGAICFYKAGPLMGRHVAFVHTPGDKYAGVKGFEYEGVEDSLVYDSNIYDGVSLAEIWIMDAAKKLLVSLHDEEGNVYDKLTDVGKRTVIDILNSGYDKKEDDIVEDKKVEDKNKPGDEPTEDKKELPIDLEDTVTMTDTELEAVLERLTEDAKLSYEARKKLPSSSFCGPDRSFPAHDAEHVRKGLQMLSKSNYTSSQKAKIYGCLKSRAGKYGIKVSSKTSDTGSETKIENITILDVLLADASIDDILSLNKMVDYLKSIGLEVSAEDTCTIVVPGKVEEKIEEKKEEKVEDTSTEGSKTTVVEPEVKAEDTTNKDALAEKDVVIEDLNNTLKLTSNQNLDMMEKLKLAQAKRVVDLRILTGKATVADRDNMVKELIDKSEDDINDAITELENILATASTKIVPEDAEGEHVDGARDRKTIKPKAANRLDLLKLRHQKKGN